MKVLIAIKACHRYAARASAQRQTWVKEVPSGVDLRFFVGRANGHYQSGPDEVLLDVDDSYAGLPEKARMTYRWALERGYDFLFHCDDDVYVRPERLLASGFERVEYSGRVRGPNGGFPAPYASGFAVWLSRRALKILTTAPLGQHKRQDRWVGNVLLQHRIHPHHDRRYVLVKSARNTPCHPEGPRRANDIIAACEFWPQEMVRQHQLWLNGEPAQSRDVPLPASPFSRVSLMIKTFLRDGYLFHTAAAIEQHLPGMKMIIIDDGYEHRQKIKLYAELRRRGHVCHWLPFDSGFGAKANAAVEFADREYLLIGSDDFDFSGHGVPEGIRKMISVLDADKSIASAAGQVDNRPYEGFIERGSLPDGRRYIKQIRLDTATAPRFRTPEGVEYYLVDHTVNYNLVRTKELGPGRQLFETRTKMGSDHYDFYHDLRARKLKIAWLPGVNVNQLRDPALKQKNHPEYSKYRGRCRGGLPGFFRKFGIDLFISFSGHLDEVLPDGSIRQGRPR